jgi:hypothetical protein
MTLRDNLTDMQHEIESSMRDHMGSQTMCQIHKDGHVTGGLKYDEGRLVAVREIMRLLDDDPTNLPDAFEEKAAGWQRQLARYRAQERPSMPWVAYNQGGVDVYAAVRAHLREGSF